MQVGSLVELVNDTWEHHYYDVIYPVKNVIYTVRGFKEDTGIVLEEIVNRVERLQTRSGAIIIDEASFMIHKFRELQPPMEISELVEECFSIENKCYA